MDMQIEKNGQSAFSIESILTSVKKMLGVDEGYTQFDEQIILHINSVFAVLTQLGAGPPDGFSIEDKDTSWWEYLPEELAKRLAFIKSYMFLKVQLLFDPPLTSAVLNAKTQQAEEMEWRIKVAAEES